MRSDPPDAGSTAFLRFALPFLLVTAVLAIPYHLRPENFIVDDGYFYLQIARNIVAGHGSTFNGWLPTNGYHPLWMLICCACAFVARGTESLIQCASAVQDALLLAAVGLLIWLSGKRAHLISLALGCTLFWFMGEVLGIWRLLESYLAVALQLAVLAIVLRERWRTRSAYQDIGFGLLLGCTLLARLDLIFFAGTVLLWQLLDNPGTFSARIRSAAIQFAATCCVVVPYLAWNMRHFGHMVPVSGAIKNTFPHLHGIAHLTPDIYLVAVGTAANLLLLRTRHRTMLQQAALLSALASALYLAYALSFTAVWPWYFTTGTITIAFAAVRLGDAVVRRVALPVSLQAAIAALIVAALFASALVRTRTNLSMTRALVSRNLSLHTLIDEPRHRLALQLKQRLPANARIFVFDTPGSLAYYSGLSITPADGLVCDYGYSADLLRTGFAAYARQHDMQYIVVPQLAPGQDYDWLETAGVRHGTQETIQVFAPMKHRPAGSVDLQDDQLLFTAPTIQPGFERAMPLVGVWRLSAD